MIKSGLIAGAVSLVFVALVSLVSPLCAACVGLLLGLGAGYLAGVFDKPMDVGQSAKKGAIAGAIAGGIAILGQFIGAVINGSVMQDPSAQALNELLGLPPTDATTLWIAQLAIACCIGLINILLMAGTGAGGGAIWYQVSGKKSGEVVEAE